MELDLNNSSSLCKSLTYSFRPSVWVTGVGVDAGKESISIA